MTEVRPTAAAATGIVLLTLASGQFLMTLDSSASFTIATVASDPNTDSTGIQTAITLYTLVMASLMAGGKIGELVGRRRAFAIGCVIYGAGSLTTALAPNLLVLIVGSSVLEGVGAALIMPAIVALVALNFLREGPSVAGPALKGRGLRPSAGVRCAHPACERTGGRHDHHRHRRERVRPVRGLRPQRRDRGRR